LIADWTNSNINTVGVYINVGKHLKINNEKNKTIAERSQKIVANNFNILIVSSAVSLLFEHKYFSNYDNWRHYIDIPFLRSLAFRNISGFLGNDKIDFMDC